MVTMPTLSSSGPPSCTNERNVDCIADAISHRRRTGRIGSAVGTPENARTALATGGRSGRAKSVRFANGAQPR